ncbi:uncharacterized protein MONOS_4102 [Monocercomonoides exilis]|uniref:uncharacterized protein n=1 Tax=Monocercomonoides exilis TaxID=2049356 RepID=UPI0035595716|nr:hypothetical protein MONOS_4102 [Monocercomonoides exilis]|eukprot:MONOS_4102.1-p1 / transcript=MONOS_4102.1 / gene=MONOS_4102 / organism=Monocercomonoides_exilis_PA203 / gene_product=unspecified product / transcript_product=unspecified product / location=Mono_scaffold00104:85684-90205(+) / protein_length=1367 / sequence_SO=supercontig / SO=protein_coding / is_pseudo=false
MEIKEQCRVLVENNLSPNDSLRKPASASLENLSSTNPDLFVQYMLSLLEPSQPDYVVKFILSQLRRQLAARNPKFSIFNKISLQTRNALHSALNSAFLNLSFNPVVSIHITHCYSNFLSLLLDVGESEKTATVKALGEWATSPELRIREGAILIFSEIIDFNGKHFLQYIPQLYEIFRNALTDTQSKKMNRYAIRAITVLLFLVKQDKKTLKHISELAPVVLVRLESLLAEGDYSGAIETQQLLIDLADKVPNFFRATLSSWLEKLGGFITVSSNAIEESDQAAATPGCEMKVLPASVRENLKELRSITTTFLVSLIRPFKIRLGGSKELAAVVAIGWRLLVNARLAEDKQWMEDEDNEDPDDTISLGLQVFSDISGTFRAEQYFRPFFPAVFQPALHSAQPKEQYMAIRAIATSLEGVKDELTKQEIGSVLDETLAVLCATSSPSSSSSLTPSSGLSQTSSAATASSSADASNAVVIPSNGLAAAYPRIGLAILELFNSLFSAPVQRFVKKKPFVIRAVSAVLSIMQHSVLNTIPSIRMSALRLLAVAAANIPKSHLKPLLPLVIPILYSVGMSQMAKERIEAVRSLVEVADAAEELLEQWSAQQAEQVNQMIQAMMVVVEKDVLPTDSEDLITYQGVVVDCVSALLVSCGKTIAARWIAQFTGAVLKMFNALSSPSSSSSPADSQTASKAFSSDQRLDSIQSVWTRLPTLLGGRFAPLLPLTVPLLLKDAQKKAALTEADIDMIASTATSIGAPSDSTPGDQMEGKSTSMQDSLVEMRGEAENALSDRENALLRLSIIARSVGPYFAPYVEPCITTGLSVMEEARTALLSISIDSAASLVSNCIICVSPRANPAEDVFHPLYPQSHPQTAADSALPPLPPLPPIPDGCHPVALFTRFANCAMPLLIDSLRSPPEVSAGSASGPVASSRELPSVSMSAAVRTSVASSLIFALESVSPLLTPTPAPEWSKCMSPWAQMAGAPPSPSPWAALPLPQSASGHLDVLGLTKGMKELLLRIRYHKKLLMKSLGVVEHAEAGTQDDADDVVGVDELDDVDEYESTNSMSGSVLSFVTLLFRTYGDAFCDGFLLLLPIITEMAATPTPENPLPFNDDADRALALYMMTACIKDGGNKGQESISTFAPYFLYYADPSHSIAVEETDTRIAALTALGRIADANNASSAPVLQQALEYAKHWIKVNVNSMEESQLEAYDNAVAVLMRVLQYFMRQQSSVLDAAQVFQLKRLWYECLPLSTDVDEAVWCHDQLLRMLQASDTAVFGKTPDVAQRCLAVLRDGSPVDRADDLVAQELRRLLSVLVQIVSSPLVSKEADEKLQEFLRSLTKCFPAEYLAKMWNMLDEERQEDLLPLFK